MIESNLPTLAYNARQYRVRILLTRERVQSSPLPPLDLMARAKEKLESIKKEGKIQFFELYVDRLNQVWKKLRSAESLASGYVISVTVGAGSPAIPGLTVSNSGAAKPGVFISTAAPIDLNVIPREWLRLSINKMAADQGIIAGTPAPWIFSCSSLSVNSCGTWLVRRPAISLRANGVSAAALLSTRIFRSS